MKPHSVVTFLIWIMPWYRALSDDFSDIEIYDVNEPRSRLLMVDGHMWFHAGRGKNLTFKTSGGGSIFVDNTDISKLPELVRSKRTLSHPRWSIEILCTHPALIVPELREDLLRAIDYRLTK